MLTWSNLPGQRSSTGHWKFHRKSSQTRQKVCDWSPPHFHPACPDLALPGVTESSHSYCVRVCAAEAVQVFPLQQERRFQHPPCPGILQGSTEGIRVVLLLPGTHINITGVACTPCSLLSKQLHLILISGRYISLAVSLSCKEHQSEDSSAV